MPDQSWVLELSESNEKDKKPFATYVIFAVCDVVELSSKIQKCRIQLFR
jgi:hypothetical protein